MRKNFPLFQSHLDLTKKIWSSLIQGPSTVIDATLGNGKDAAFLIHLLEKFPNSHFYGLDIQETALIETKKEVGNLPKWAALYCQSHATFPPEITPASAALLVYNLGYLPGGDKAITTQTSTTLQSVEAGLSLLQSGGIISITLYPGHEEGKREAEALIDWGKALSPKEWSVSYLQFTNRKASPALLLIQKAAASEG